MSNVVWGAWIQKCQTFLQFYADSFDTRCVPYMIKLLPEMDGQDDFKGVLRRSKVYEVEFTRTSGDLIEGIPGLPDPLLQIDPDHMYFLALVLTIQKKGWQTILNPDITNIPINDTMPLFGQLPSGTPIDIYYQQLRDENNTWQFGHINAETGKWRQAVLTCRSRRVRLLEKTRVQFEFEYSNDCDEEWHTLHGVRVADTSRLNYVFPNIAVTNEQVDASAEKAKYEGIFRPLTSAPSYFYEDEVQNINSGSCTRPYPIPPTWITPVNTAGVAFDPPLPWRQTETVITVIGPLQQDVRPSYIQGYTDAINKDEFYIVSMREGYMVDILFCHQYTVRIEKVTALPDRFCGHNPWYTRLEFTLKHRYGKVLTRLGEPAPSEFQGWRDLVPNVGNAHFVCEGDVSPIGGTYTVNEKLEVTVDSSGQPRQNTWLDKYGRDATLTYPGATAAQQFHMLYRRFESYQFADINRAVPAYTPGIPGLGRWLYPNKEEFLEDVSQTLDYRQANYDALSDRWDFLLGLSGTTPTPE